jgi:hypothetical protein
VHRPVAIASETSRRSRERSKPRQIREILNAGF